MKFYRRFSFRNQRETFQENGKRTIVLKRCNCIYILCFKSTIINKEVSFSKIGKLTSKFLYKKKEQNLLSFLFSRISLMASVHFIHFEVRFGLKQNQNIEIFFRRIASR